LEKGVATKTMRIERLLNFLVQTDKLWDRQVMLERSRAVFLNVLLAREAGDTGKVSDGELFPATADALRGEIVQRQQHGASIEYRNLCVRKVELVHVNNQTDAAQDEFTVRISAHAQRIIQKSGVEVGRDEDVTPFTQFWTFGRHDGEWKLKEVLPEANGEEMLMQENVDAGTSPDQLEWYYRQTRAV
jgi:predicted lipid-binding transport protein (Tim44 family)